MTPDVENITFPFLPPSETCGRPACCLPNPWVKSHSLWVLEGSSQLHIFIRRGCKMLLDSTGRTGWEYYKTGKPFPVSLGSLHEYSPSPWFATVQRSAPPGTQPFFFTSAILTFCHLHHRPRLQSNLTDIQSPPNVRLQSVHITSIFILMSSSPIFVIFTFQGMHG